MVNLWFEVINSWVSPWINHHAYFNLFSTVYQCCRWRLSKECQPTEEWEVGGGKKGRCNLQALGLNMALGPQCLERPSMCRNSQRLRVQVVARNGERVERQGRNRIAWRHKCIGCFWRALICCNTFKMIKFQPETVHLWQLTGYMPSEKATLHHELPTSRCGRGSDTGEMALASACTYMHNVQTPHSWNCTWKCPWTFLGAAQQLFFFNLFFI